MNILICNAGSTSLKFQLFDMPSERALCRGKVERVGSRDDALFSYKDNLTGETVTLDRQDIPDYRTGINLFLARLDRSWAIDRVGFKTVLAKGWHGVHELTEPVLAAMDAFMPIAPAHNGPYLEAIRTLRAILPDTPFVGAFETDFHRTIPLERVLYGVPYEWYEKYDLRRMGFHGASHGFVASVLTAEFGETYRAISCHLGGSCSLCAIENGNSVDTSFGMSLQTGVIHANRVGDMDCELPAFLLTQGLTPAEVNQGLTKKGGLLGLSGVSNDLRYIEEAAEAGNTRARLAIDVFVNGIVRYAGAFFAEMGGLDLLVFTGGIGENSTVVRQAVCQRLRALGVELADDRNASGEPSRVISTDTSRVKVLIIPANEEIHVARKVFACTDFVKND